MIFRSLLKVSTLISLAFLHVLTIVGCAKFDRNTNSDHDPEAATRIQKKFFPSQRMMSIRNGTVVERGASLAAHVVKIVVQRPLGLLSGCTGVVVDNQTILTAAHCFPERDNQAWVIFSNDSYNYDLGHKIQVQQLDFLSDSLSKEAFSSEDYRNFDLVLLRLVDFVPDDFAPIELARTQSEISAQENFEILGYGEDESHHKDGKLRQVGLKLDLSDSSRRLALVGADNVGGAKGDSGGPAFYTQDGKWYLAGICSFIVEDTDLDKVLTTNYVNVVRWKDWITSHNSRINP